MPAATAKKYWDQKWYPWAACLLLPSIFGKPVYILLPYVQWCQPVLLHQMPLQTTAAPYLCASRAWCKNFFPSLREIELMIHFPCTHLSPVSITLHLLLSIITGTLAMSGSDITKCKNVSMAFFHCRNKPSSIFTSMICAPASTCCLATANASCIFHRG